MCGGGFEPDLGGIAAVTKGNATRPQTDANVSKTSLAKKYDPGACWHTCVQCSCRLDTHNIGSVGYLRKILGILGKILGKILGILGMILGILGSLDTPNIGSVRSDT